MKLLSIDIETKPLVSYHWRLHDENIAINQIQDHGGMMCFAAKWYGEDDVFFYDEHHDGHHDMVGAAHDLLDEADIVMGWNSTSFDVKHLNAEFLLNEFGPPSPYKKLDLMRETKKHFRFPSNKLQYVTTRLGLAGKVQHSGMDLWDRCMHGDEDAWVTMKEYNIQDVVLVEDTYEYMLPWLDTHPNRAVLDGVVDGCRNCAGVNLQRRGKNKTQTGKYQRYQCNDCGTWMQSTKREPLEVATIR